MTAVGRIALAVVGVVVVLCVTAGTAGGWAYGVLLLLPALFAPFGAGIAYVVGGSLYESWYIPGRGITVVAEFDHYTHVARVYRYADGAGNSHTYTSKTGGDRVAVSYLPRAPHRAVVASSTGERVALGFMTVVGGAVCVAGLAGVAVVMAEAFTA